MTQAVTTQDTQQEIGRSWWLWLLWGICIMIIGVLMIAHPVSTAMSLTIFLGAWWFVSGVIDVVMSIWKRQGPWGWFLFTGIVSVLAGLVLMANPLISLGIAVNVAYYIIAFLFIFVGLIRTFAGWRNSNGIGYRWTWGSLVIGLLMVALGGVMLFSGDPDAANFFAIFMPIMGIMALIAGIVAIVFAFQVRLAS